MDYPVAHAMSDVHVQSSHCPMYHLTCNSDLGMFVWIIDGSDK